MLQIVDNMWKDHLLSMDHLRDGIGLRGYAQVDPLREYQREGYEIFMDLIHRIEAESVGTLFHLQVQPHQELPEEARPQRATHVLQPRRQRPGPTPAAPTEEDRPQRPLPLRQRQEIQEVLREIGLGGGPGMHKALPLPQTAASANAHKGRFYPWHQASCLGFFFFLCILLAGEPGVAFPKLRGHYEQIDLKKDLKPLYTASVKEATLVTAPPLKYLMFNGFGDPNANPEFPAGVEALYTASYTLKFMLKQAQGLDYVVPPLEGLWWMLMADFDLARRDDWRWTLMIPQPEPVNRELLDLAVAAARKKKALPALEKLRLEIYHEGQAAQILHVGPYSRGDGHRRPPARLHQRAGLPSLRQAPRNLSERSPAHRPGKIEDHPPAAHLPGAQLTVGRWPPVRRLWIKK